MRKFNFIKESVKHFWDYYKIHVMSIILFIFLIFLLDFPSLINKPETKWSGLFINSTINQEEADSWMTDFKSNYLNDSNENHEYKLDTTISFSLKEEDYTDYDQMGKFTALIAGHEVDLVISNKETIQHYAQLDGFIDLNDLLKDKIDLIDSNILYLKNSKNEDIAFGIDLTNFFSTDNLDESNQRVIAAIPINSERKKITAEFLMYLETYGWGKERITLQ